MNEAPTWVRSSSSPWFALTGESHLIWANNAMQRLFEEVTGTRRHEGEDLNDVEGLARLLERSPEWHVPSTSRVFRVRWVSDEHGWFAELTDRTGVLALEHELSNARRKLEQANQVQSDFLGNMSHELRTPLNALVGLSEMALEHVTPQNQRAVEGMRTNALSLLHRISALLDFSKLEAGLLDLEVRPCDVRALIEEVAERHRPSAEERGLEWVVEVLPTVPDRVRTDPDRLRQVANNLLANALKFTARGRVSVLLEPVQTSKGHAMLQLTVEDTGMGIPKRDQQLVFTRFYQSYRTSEVGSGTGIGLAMTKAIVELLGGGIRLRSKPGVGSRFQVRVPLETVDTPSLRPRLGEAPLVRRIRILVADDSPDNLLVVTRLLRTNGDVVQTAANGVEALDRYASSPFDVVVMDVDMAPMDGLRATVEIRARESLLGAPRTPIVALTAHAVPEVRRRCHDSGMDEFLTKPVDADALLDTIERLVDRRPHVLVVDDAPTSRLVVEAAMKAAGAVPHPAASGEEALAALGMEAIDVALVDFALPDVKGPELVRQMRSRGFTNKVFAITGHGQAHAKLWSDVGVERVFEKPLQLPELLASMRAVLMPVVRVVDPDIADLVPEYLEDRRADLVTMQEALRCQDADTLRRIGHQVRGSGTSYGYPDLTELGQAIESAAKEADWGTLPDLLVQMTEILTP